MEERLRKFASVAENGSYTRAAEQLHISQPALSTALRKLERELGARLFEHGKQPLTLTTTGKAAYAHARELAVADRNFKTRLAALAREKPHARIGMIDSIAHTLLVANDQLTELEKHVRVSLSVNNSRVLLHALETGELDIVLIAAPPAPVPRTLHETSVGSEPLLCVTRPSRLTATMRALQDGTLPGYISYDRLSHTNRLISEHFARQNVALQSTLYSTSPDIILHMVRTGRGTGVLPYSLVAPHLTRGDLAAIAAPVARPIVVLQHNDARLPTPLGVLRQMAVTILAEQNDRAQTFAKHLPKK